MAKKIPTKHRNQYIGLKELYCQYRYRWRDINSNTVPVPYISVEDISNHKYKMPYKEWCIVMTTYFEVICEYLLTGQPFKLPIGLGVLQIRKHKTMVVDSKTTIERYKAGQLKKGKAIKFKNSHTDGFRPIVKWYRGQGHSIHFKNQWWYKCNFVRSRWSKISKKIFETPSIIYNFNNI